MTATFSDERYFSLGQENPRYSISNATLTSRRLNLNLIAPSFLSCGCLTQKEMQQRRSCNRELNKFLVYFFVMIKPL